MDLSHEQNAIDAVKGAVEVYNLAADMGGMGYIANHHAEILHNNALINLHTIEGSRQNGIQRYLYSSSACVYNADKQTSPDVIALKEADAYPAMPEDGYGWEKLFSETHVPSLPRRLRPETRVARFHNVYGPDGTWDGGREKAPAAVCRKVIAAKLSGQHEIEIWGDGNQTRSFMYIDDCLHGTVMFLRKRRRSNRSTSASSELVSINQLVDIVEDIAGIKLKRNYNLRRPEGRHRSQQRQHADPQHSGWEPSIKLRDGMAKTYAWIYEQFAARKAGKRVVEG